MSNRVDIDVFFKSDNASIENLFLPLSKEIENSSKLFEPLKESFEGIFKSDSLLSFSGAFLPVKEEIISLEEESKNLKDSLEATFQENYEFKLETNTRKIQELENKLDSLGSKTKKLKGNSFKDFSQIFKGFNLGGVGGQLKEVTGMAKNLTSSFSSLGKVSGGLTSSLGGVSGSLAVASLGFVAVAGAVVGLGFALSETIKQLNKFKEEAMYSLGGGEEMADAWVESMNALASQTGRSRQEYDKLGKVIYNLKDSNLSINETVEIMKKLEILTNGNNTAMKKMPAIIQEIEKEGKITDNIFKEISRTLNTDVATEIDRVFRYEGKSAVEAFTLVVNESVKGTEKLKDIKIDPDGQIENNILRIKESLGTMFTPLSDKLKELTAGVTEFFAHVLEKATIGFQAIGDLVSFKNPLEEYEKRLEAKEKALLEKENAEFKIYNEKYNTDEIFRASEDIKGAIDYLNSQMLELDQVKTLSAEQAQKGGFRSVEEVLKSIEYTKEQIEKLTIENRQGLKNSYEEEFNASFEAIGKANSVLEQNTAKAVSTGIVKGSDQAFPPLKIEWSNIIASSFESGLSGTGALFSNIAQNGVEGAITGSLNLTKTLVGEVDKTFKAVGSSFQKAGKSLSETLGKTFNDMFTSLPVIGGVIGGVSGLFTGIVALFGGVSAKKQKEINDRYYSQLDSLNENFERENEIRSKAIKKLEASLDAYQKAFDAGQLSAEEFFNIRNDIGQEIETEKIAQAKATKLRDLESEELKLKKEYEENEAKWFPDGKKRKQLQYDIDRIKYRKDKVQNASTIAEVNMAKDGALQKVTSPTLFMAGEAGAELVKVQPLKAGIDPALRENNNSQISQNFNFNLTVNGFVGNETELGKKMFEIMKKSFNQLGEGFIKNYT